MELTQELDQMIKESPTGLCFGFEKPTAATDDIRIEEEDVNIMVGEQFTERFLCNINAAGEVGISPR